MNVIAHTVKNEVQYMTLQSDDHTIIAVCNTPTVSYITPTSVVCTLYFFYSAGFLG